MLSISEMPTEDIDRMITNIIDPFNALQQAVSRCRVCVEYASHSYNRLVDVNSVKSWNIYFMEDRTRLYSKGIERKNAIKVAYNDPRFQLLGNVEKWFVFAGLIIIYQMYGDGNHRTASYVYTYYTGLSYPSNTIDAIRYLYKDVHITDGIPLEYIIPPLLDIYHKHINIKS